MLRPASARRHGAAGATGRMGRAVRPADRALGLPAPAANKDASAEVIFMLFALMLLAALITACVVGAWLDIRWAVRDSRRKPAGQNAPDAASAPDRSPQTLEGVLARQLVADEITGPQYRHAMAAIAARDAERHPLEVPPDVAPPEAA
jgi:hypothetical protein